MTRVDTNLMFCLLELNLAHTTDSSTAAQLFVCVATAHMLLALWELAAKALR